MFEKLKNKLKQIQEGDKKIKKRWVVAMSFLAMSIIVGGWIVYLNFAATMKLAVKNDEKSGFDSEKLEKELVNIKEKIKEVKNEFSKIFKINENGQQSSEN